MRVVPVQGSGQTAVPLRQSSKQADFWHAPKPQFQILRLRRLPQDPGKSHTLQGLGVQSETVIAAVHRYIYCYHLHNHMLCCYCLDCWLARDIQCFLIMMRAHSLQSQ